MNLDQTFGIYKDTLEHIGLNLSDVTVFNGKLKNG